MLAEGNTSTRKVSFQFNTNSATSSSLKTKANAEIKNLKTVIPVDKFDLRKGFTKEKLSSLSFSKESVYSGYSSTKGESPEYNSLENNKLGKYFFCGRLSTELANELIDKAQSYDPDVAFIERNVKVQNSLFKQQLETTTVNGKKKIFS